MRICQSPAPALCPLWGCSRVKAELPLELHLCPCSFYGNKVFQSSFIAILSPDATILVNLLWTLLNSGIALIGYWLAACVIDNARVGRLRLQLLGFFMVSPGPRLQHVSCRLTAGWHLHNSVSLR